MLNPLSQMLIYSVVFGSIFGVKTRVGDPSGIDIYGLYLLSGILPWGFINLISGLGMQALNRQLGTRTQGEVCARNFGVFRSAL